VAVAALALPATPARATDMQPGTYERWSTFVAPRRTPLSTHDTYCMTREEAKDAERRWLATFAPDGCTRAGQHIDLGHLVADIACTLDGKDETRHIDLTFTHTSVEGSFIDVTDAHGTFSSSTTLTLHVHRIGDCP
jgi:hypothetical protein